MSRRIPLPTMVIVGASTTIYCLVIAAFGGWGLRDV